jgi:hypothetical protein
VPDDLMWLQGDITFTTLMNQCDTNLGGAPESCATTTNALTGGTQYGIQVYNWDISQVSFTITVN